MKVILKEDKKQVHVHSRLYRHSPLSVQKKKKEKKKGVRLHSKTMAFTQLRQDPTYLLPRQQVYLSQPGHIYKSDTREEVELEYRTTVNHKMASPIHTLSFPLACWNTCADSTHTFIKTKTRQTTRAGNESEEKEGMVSLDKESEATS